MKHSRELLAGLTLTASLAIGATACGGSAQTESKHTSSEVTNPNSAELQKAAALILNLTEQSPTRYESKPPNSLGFTVTTDEGGELRYSIQTSTQQHSPSQTEFIGINQTGPNEANFDLSFYVNRDGNWDMACLSNPSSSHPRAVEEVDQKSIQLNGKTVDTRASDANAMLSDEVGELDRLIGTVAEMKINARASTNACDFTIG